MTPSQFRAILDAAMRRPWKMNGCHVQAPPFGDVATVRATDDRPWQENATAIVATMNLADALAELWDAIRRTHNVNLLSESEAVESALRRLEEAKP